MPAPPPKPAFTLTALGSKLKSALSEKGWEQCFDIHFSPAGKPQQTGELRAGLSEVDITPFPGVPKGGYSAMSQTAVGFRGRLKARVFYIRPASGESFCLLQADLHAGSALIRNRVAELVAPHTDINPGNLMLTCTHTHSGPGQLLESNFYNRFASHKPGLDWELFQQICHKVADAVIQAYQQQRPARIASGVTQVTGVTRNRSIVPYLNNRDATGNPRHPGLKYQAVNPDLHLVRFDLQADDGNFYPAGAFSNFSIHGTCIPASNDVFSADSWSYVSGELEDWITQTYEPPWKPIHGPSQGTHGDIAPDVKHKDIGFPEAQRIGSAIAREAALLFRDLEDRLTTDYRVQAGLRHVDFYNQPEIDGITIASRPMLGTALTAGAFEHSTPVLYHLPLFRHGLGSARLFSVDAEHGRKRKVAGDLQRLFLPKADFPHRILFQTAQLGNLVLVGVPFEVTVKAGEEIAAAVRVALKQHGHGTHQVCVASLTNGYTGYSTTAAEYEKQYYEGGHTLYGPETNRFIARHCQRLMADTLDNHNVFDVPEVWPYRMQCRPYQKRDCDNAGQRPPVRWLAQPSWHHRPTEPYCEAAFEWAEPWRLAWSGRLVSVEEEVAAGEWFPLRNSQGVVADNNGCEFEIRYEQNRYLIRWYPGYKPTQKLRLVLWDGTRPVTASSSFLLPGD
ncbi:MAG: neutral/alkaline non-lysosomal ceramidase N-terminal domain-containing protein [Ketobacteraceae bacterium]|nr:neutral/alkaline non-lysosomal ceramidase N-terminal domain-containing protein [Ketobacteraceae bacterium]